jgi:hypothetical protein
VIFNNKIGWFVIAFLLFVSSIQFIKDCIDRERFGDIIYVILMYAVIYLLFLMLYPKKLTPKESIILDNY